MNFTTPILPFTFPLYFLFRNIVVSANFGPDFAHPPSLPGGWRGMHERAQEATVEQCLADMLYLVENEGKLRLDMLA